MNETNNQKEIKRWRTDVTLVMLFESLDPTACLETCIFWILNFMSQYISMSKKKKGYICWNLVSVACNKKMFWRIHVTARKVWPTSSSVAECILMNFKNAFFQRGLIWATVASGLTKTFLSFEQLHTWCWIAGWGGGGWGVNKTVPEHGTHFTASFMWGREIPCYHKK